VFTLSAAITLLGLFVLAEGLAQVL